MAKKYCNGWEYYIIRVSGYNPSRERAKKLKKEIASLLAFRKEGFERYKILVLFSHRRRQKPGHATFNVDVVTDYIPPTPGQICRVADAVREHLNREVSAKGGPSFRMSFYRISDPTEEKLPPERFFRPFTRVEFGV